MNNLGNPTGTWAGYAHGWSGDDDGFGTVPSFGATPAPPQAQAVQQEALQQIAEAPPPKKQMGKKALILGALLLGTFLLIPAVGKSIDKGK